MEGDKCSLEKKDVIIDKTNASRSISVSGFPSKTTATDLVIHFQKRKHGGGDVECIHITDNRVAVIVFDDAEVANSVLSKKQKLSGMDVPLIMKPMPDMGEVNNTPEIFQLVTAWLDDSVLKNQSREEIRLILNKVKNETAVDCGEVSEGFWLNGTLKQVTDSRVLLGKLLMKNPQSTAARWKTPRKPSDKEMEEDVTQTDAVEGSFGHGPNDTKGFRDKENNDDEMASTGLKPQQYETTQKFFPLFVKAHDEELQKIEKDFQVKVSRVIDDGKVTIAPCDHCKADEFSEACEAFINLYQKVHQCMKLEQFLPNDQVLPTRVRQRIRDAVKKVPVVTEVSEDRKHWQVYGEEHFVKKALDYLEEENLISRKSVATRATESWDRDEMEENEAGFENHLEHMLGQVKLSVLKGDITDQHVDVIVNAANTSLSHGAGVAGAILKKGGRGIQKESDNYIKLHGMLKDGEVAMTGPGKLPCKNIIHAVGPMWKIGERNSKRLLKKACQESLETASISSFKSIAFPAISSGIYGMPKDVCAKVMITAVKEYVMKQDPRKQTLTDIRFVNIDDPTVSVFKKEFTNFFELEKESSFANSAQASNSRRPKRGGRKGGHPDKTAKNKHEALHDPLSATSDTPPKSFSDAVKGNKRDGADDGEDGSSSSPKDSASGGAGSETECPICLDTLTNARTLRCKHVFCSDCLEKALEHNNRCPVCKEAQGVIKGNQPHGKMDVFKNRQRLPGYNDCGTIIITYSFSSGIQGQEHPNPGQWYSGTDRTAYLPDNREGNEVLQLLRRAFDARLVFTVGTSVTTGRQNQVTWNDIHHKTNTGGGPQAFGYPDPDYLRRVKEDLAAKGIR